MLQNLWEMVAYYKEAIIFLSIITIMFVVLHKHNKKNKVKRLMKKRVHTQQRWVVLRKKAEAELRNAASQNTSGTVRISGIGNEIFYAIMAESVIGQQKGCVIAKLEIRPAEKFPVKISTGKEKAIMSNLTSEEISKLCEVVRSFDPVETLR